MFSFGVTGFAVVSACFIGRLGCYYDDWRSSSTNSSNASTSRGDPIRYPRNTLRLRYITFHFKIWFGLQIIESIFLILGSPYDAAAAYGYEGYGAQEYAGYGAGEEGYYGYGGGYGGGNAPITIEIEAKKK